MVCSRSIEWGDYMQVGNRIFYYQDGEIIFQTGDMEGDIPKKKDNTSVNYIDLPFGYVDWRTQRIVSIDPVTHEPVIEIIEPILSEEQQKIQELENQLLLAEDAAAGGIL